jgi:histidyl-tRNA synthetase
MEAIGLSGAVNAGRRLIVLRAIDKLDRLGPTEVHKLLGAGRTDESGDITKGAALNDDQSNRLIWFLRLREHAVNPEVSEFNPEIVLGEKQQKVDMLTAMDNAYGEYSPIFREGIAELRTIETLVALHKKLRIHMDPSVVRGLEYYTGPVFEAELTFEVKDEAGRPVRFGSVGGGGRYDGLVARFRGEPVPATGFSIGVSRLLSALRAIDSPIVASAKKPGPVVVVVLDRDHMADYQRLVAQLRAAGIASELYLGSSGLNAQLKYADRRGSHCAVIQGSNERDAAGGRQVVIRDLVLGAELAKASKDRADYLELRQRAQALAPEAELAARVEEVLARHRV